MILTLVDVVLPVFLVLGAGYLATKFGFFKAPAVDALMAFTLKFAIPCLLFKATSQLDLSTSFDWRLLLSFYTGAVISFCLGVLGARYIFRRRPGEAVAIGFAALFSNTVMLGLPIMERAFGADALAPNYAIVAIHAPFCYFVGITLMEITRADGRGFAETASLVFRAMFKNALMIGLALGFVVNFSGVKVPVQIMAAVDLMVHAALPTAIFGLGGILTRYAIRDNLDQVAMVGILSLVVHPSIVWFLTVNVFELPVGMIRGAVISAAMAPGANTYIFAAMYDRGAGVNSSSVLLLTLLSILSVSFWLSILP